MGDTKGDPTFLIKVAAGLTTGALAITVASPTDLVKVKPGPGSQALQPHQGGSLQDDLPGIVGGRGMQGLASASTVRCIQCEVADAYH